MTKRAIKIVKRDRPLAKTETVSRESQLRRGLRDENDMSNTVKNWIAERRVNSLTEQGEAAATVFAWSSDSETAA